MLSVAFLPLLQHKCFNSLQCLEAWCCCVESRRNHKRPARRDCSVWPSQNACSWKQRDRRSGRSIQATGSWDTTNNKSEEMLIDLIDPQCFNFIFKEDSIEDHSLHSRNMRNFPRPMDLNRTLKFRAAYCSYYFYTMQ